LKNVQAKPKKSVKQAKRYLTGTRDVKDSAAKLPQLQKSVKQRRLQI
jgi:hypothetical protein